MFRFLAFLLLCTAGATAQDVPQASLPPIAIPDGLVPPAEPTISSALPAAPKGKSTVIGGRIEKVDLVRDQLTLKVFGGHPITVLFDERTMVYSNGKKISVLNLHPDNHASIETTLDGSAVFALRIHMLSDLPEGQYRGQIVAFNSQTGEMKIRVTTSNDLVTLKVPAATPVVRIGQETFTAQKPGRADLMPGSVVDVAFQAGNAGHGSATHVDVVAVPGAQFLFRGNLSFLDVRAGRMAIEGPADSPTMDVIFDPAHFPVSQDLRQGSTVKVMAHFDGQHYIANEISIPQ